MLLVTKSNFFLTTNIQAEITGLSTKSQKISSNLSTVLALTWSLYLLNCKNHSFTFTTYNRLKKENI